MSRLYFSNDDFFPLKFNESFENWRIVSMSQVQILKINDWLAKIWLKIKVLLYIKSFSFVSRCINEIHRICFPSKLSFCFPFHSVFYFVPFSVPRFSNTHFVIVVIAYAWKHTPDVKRVIWTVTELKFLSVILKQLILYSILYHLNSNSTLI